MGSLLWLVVMQNQCSSTNYVREMTAEEDALFKKQLPMALLPGPSTPKLNLMRN